MLFVFFFSSRRRHTRWPRDWSSDVCSSDLYLQLFNSSIDFFKGMSFNTLNVYRSAIPLFAGVVIMTFPASYFESIPTRSEERRVGKECKSGRGSERYKKTVMEVEVEAMR